MRAGGQRFPGAGLQHSIILPEQGGREEVVVQGAQMQNVAGIQGNLRRVPALDGVPGVQGTIRRGRFKVKRVPSGAQEDGFLRSKQHEEGKLEATKGHCGRLESDRLQHQQDASDQHRAGG